MRPTVTALLLLVSGATAAVAQSAKQNPSAQAPQKSHCAVGVVSHLGEKFRVDESGLPENEVSEVPVESWHLDDLVVNRIRGALGKRLAVQRIPYRKEASFETPKLFQFPDYNGSIRTLATGTRCVRYVVVTEGTFSTGYPSYLIGLGIKKGVVALLIHAVIRVLVFDGDTFKLLNSRMAHTVRSSYAGIFGNTPPERKVDESFWPVSPNSTAHNAKLREATRELVARDLDAMLPGLPLTP